MTQNVREWIQEEFITPEAEFYRYRGDFSAMSGLMPTRDRRQLRRLPAWSTATAFGTDMSYVRGMIWSVPGTRHVLIGHEATGTAGLGGDIRNSAFGAVSVQEYTTATEYLGGLSMRNVLYAHDALYLIGLDGEVYRGAYNAALTAMSIGVTAQVLALSGDRLFAADDDGIIYKQNDAGTGFDTYFDPVQDMDVRYMTAYKGYLLVIARANDGALYLYRLPDRNAQGLSPIASVRGGTGNMNTHGSLFALAHDRVFFSTGYHVNQDDSLTVPIYAFNGTNATLVTQIENIPPSTYLSMGFLHWRDELLFVSLDDGASVDQTFKILLNNKFTDIDTVTAAASGGFVPYAFASADHLVLTANPSTVKSFYYTQASALQDGYWISSRLDMGQPGRSKFLQRITLLLNDAATNFKPIIKYRIDETSGWTTATTGNNTRRVTIEGLNTDFYTLQLRIDLDDDTGNDEDIRIDTVSVTYTIDT